MKSTRYQLWEPVKTKQGWLTIQSLEKGNKVIDKNNNEKEVMDVKNSTEQVYKVEYEDNTSTLAIENTYVNTIHENEHRHRTIKEIILMLQKKEKVEVEICKEIAFEFEKDRQELVSFLKEKLNTEILDSTGEITYDGSEEDIYKVAIFARSLGIFTVVSRNQKHAFLFPNKKRKQIVSIGPIGEQDVNILVFLEQGVEYITSGYNTITGEY